MSAPTVPVDATILQDVFVRRDELVRAITAAMGSDEWDQVMGAFDGLLVSIKRLEECREAALRTRTS